MGCGYFYFLPFYLFCKGEHLTLKKTIIIKTMLRFNSILCILLFSFLSLNIYAQRPISENAFKQYPHWIQMMDDTSANYFETEKAFSLYWSIREKPKEEDEILGMSEANEKEKENKEGWLKRLFRKKRDIDETEMAFALKRYKHWHFMMEPWVQEDGRILYPSERKAILDSIDR